MHFLVLSSDILSFYSRWEYSNPSALKEKRMDIHTECFFHNEYLTRAIWRNFIKLNKCECEREKERDPTAVHLGTTVLGTEL
jgi:hypothetical protein